MMESEDFRWIEGFKMNSYDGRINILSSLTEKERESLDWVPTPDEDYSDLIEMSRHDRLLWLKNNAKNLECPCGSGLKFKKCHRTELLIVELRLKNGIKEKDG